MTEPAVVVVRCHGRIDDGDGNEYPCDREQAIETNDGGVGVRVLTFLPDEESDWLMSFGWRLDGRSNWLCPFCARGVGVVKGGAS